MPSELLNAAALIEWIRHRAEDPELLISPESMVRDLPLDSLAWLDLLFELEQATGMPTPDGVNGGMSIGEVARRYGVAWSTDN